MAKKAEENPRRRRRSRRRRNPAPNPSTAQWVVLAVGGSVGLGLLGYGIYLATKGSAAEGAQGSLGIGATYEYRINALSTNQRAARAALKQPARAYDAIVTMGGQQVRVFNTNTRQAASDRARKWIEKQGGVAVCMQGCPQDVTPGAALPA